MAKRFEKLQGHAAEGKGVIAQSICKHYQIVLLPDEKTHACCGCGTRFNLLGKAMTDEEVLRSRNDREMILRPHLWPQNPLVVKKRYGDQNGFMRQSEGGYTVAVGRGIISDRENVTYNNVDDLLADGWLVD